MEWERPLAEEQIKNFLRIFVSFWVCRHKIFHWIIFWLPEAALFLWFLLLFHLFELIRIFATFFSFLTFIFNTHSWEFSSLKFAGSFSRDIDKYAANSLTFELSFSSFVAAWFALGIGQRNFSSRRKSTRDDVKALPKLPTRHRYPALSLPRDSIATHSDSYLWKVSLRRDNRKVLRVQLVGVLQREKSLFLLRL